MKVGRDYKELIDYYLKVIITISFLGWNIIEGAIFENEYPHIFVKLYPIPVWRLLVVAAVIAGAIWDPFVGIMLAFATFFYILDMEVTMEKWK